MKSQLDSYFKNPELMDHALTHKSWVNEHASVRGSNERLEFLGDAILEFIVSEHIYLNFPDKEEGFLTSLRANLVNTVNLAKVAEKLQLGNLLKLSVGEEAGGGRQNTSLLADTTEAVIGAIYLDQGLEMAKKFISDILLSDLTELIQKPLKDAKSRLQEHVQAQGLMAPVYKVVAEKGPDHAKNFTVEVLVNNQKWGEGAGKSKGEAQQNAATKALTKLANPAIVR